MFKKLLSILLVLTLTCSCFLCCKKEDKPDSDNVVASIGDESISYELYRAAFETYMSYMNQIGGGVSSEDDLIVFQDMIMDYLIADMMVLYHVQQEGFELSDEEKQEAIKQAEEELEEIYDEYMETAEADYEEDSSKTVEQYFNEYISALSEYYLGTKLSFDEYSEEYKNEMVRSYTIEAYKDYVCKDFTISDDAIRDWYNSQHESDMEAYESFPEQYKFDQEYFEKYYGVEYDACPVTYVPDGYSRIMDIMVKPGGDIGDEYKEKQDAMEEIFKKYSELAFEDALNNTDSNAEELKKLLDEYKKLDAECEDLYNEYIAEARTKIDAAYAEIESGIDFAEVMAKYTENSDVISDDGDIYESIKLNGQIISLEYDCEPDWSDTVKEIFGMLDVGEYSNVFADDDGSLHIIKYVSDITPGDVAIDNIWDEVSYFVANDSNEDDWNELIETWLQDPNIKRNTDLIRSMGKDLIGE